MLLMYRLLKFIFEIYTCREFIIVFILHHQRRLNGRLRYFVDYEFFQLS